MKAGYLVGDARVCLEESPALSMAAFAEWILCVV